MKKNNEFQLVVFTESFIEIKGNKESYSEVLTYFSTESYIDAIQSMIDFIKGEQADEVDYYVVAEFDKEDDLINQWNFDKNGFAIDSK